MGKRRFLHILGMAVALMALSSLAYALKAPHATVGTNFVYCKSCHISPISSPPGFNAVTSFDNFCLNAAVGGCHPSVTKKKGLATTDASNRFGNLPAVGGTRKQSSHGWKLPNTNPSAGATVGWAPMREFGNMAKPGLQNKIYCTRCHRAHGDYGPDGQTIYRAFLKEDPTGDKICFQCHFARQVGYSTARRSLQSGKHYSHPVEVNYSSVRAGKPSMFEETPIDSYPSNPSAKLKLFTTAGGVKGAVICSTCHGPLHAADSNPYTFDNLSIYSKFGIYSASAGNLLRMYPAKKNDAICTSCHTVSGHQNYLCSRCHTPHKGPGEVNKYLIQERISTESNGKRDVQFISTSNMAYRYQNGYSTAQPRLNPSRTVSKGICQVCHTKTRFHRNYSSAGASRDHNKNGTGSNPTYKACVGCHLHSSGFAPTCVTCHGFPPDGIQTILSGTSISPPRKRATGAPSGGVHSKHWSVMGASGSATICSRCHSGGMSDTGMQDTNVTIKFKAFNSYTGSNQKYTGTAAVRTGYYGYSSTGIKTSGTINTQRCESVKCHGGGGWLTKSFGTPTAPYWYVSSSSKCGYCHGAKKSTAVASYNTWPTTNAHAKHAGTGSDQLNLMCKTCHNNTVLNSATTLNYNNAHVNGQTDVVFNYAAEPKTDSNSTYTGDTAVNSGFGDCMNTFCHSNGTKLSAPYNSVAYYANFTATWSDSRGSYKKTAGQMAKCNYCHGNKSYSGITSAMPNYVNYSPKANTHSQHVILNGIQCSVCHYGVARNNTGISDFTRHANRFYNISIAPGKSQGAGLKRYTSDLSGGGGTCRNNNCHATQQGARSETIRWGSDTPPGCINCHRSAVGDVDDGAFTYNNGTKAEIYSTEWTKRGHGKGSGTYPFSTSSAANKNCYDCHKEEVPHTSANSFRLYTSNPDRFCLNCHGSVGQLGSWGLTFGNVTGILNHSWTNMSTMGYKDPLTNLNGKAGWNFTPKCIDCHDPHGDKNNKMIHKYINYSGSNSIGKPGYNPTASTIMNFTAVKGGTQINWSSYVRSDNKGLCQRCHSTEVSKFAKDKFTPDHNTGQKCTGCHSHKTGFSPSESPGGFNCDICHTLYGKMRDPNTYHHVLNSNAATYPNQTSFSGSLADQTSSNRKCTMCHVDHDVFSPAKNVYGKGKRGKNLRVNAGVSGNGNDTNTFINTDFYPARSTNLVRTGVDAGTGNYADTYPVAGPAGYNGVCISCHKSVQYKNTTLQYGTGMQVARSFPVDMFKESSHNFQVISAFSKFNDGSAFRANCTKCHRSNFIDKPNAQKNARYKFGLHDKNYPSLLNTTSEEGSIDKIDIEQLCFKCHSRDIRRSVGGPGDIYDYYSTVKMGESAKAIKESEEAKLTGHPIEDVDAAGLHRPDEYYRVPKSYQAGRTGGVQGGPGSGWNRNFDNKTTISRHVECVDCHNTHGGNASIPRQTGTNLISGAQVGAWGVKVKYTPGSYTQPTYSTIPQVTKVYELCLKCHSAFAYYTAKPDDPSGGPALDIGANSFGNWSYDAVETDVGMDFNPAAHGYHPVIQQGRNQPDWDTAARGGGGTGTTGAGTNTWNPNWPNTVTGCAPCSPTPTSMANVTSQLYADQWTGEVKRAKRKGLDWAFVPPFGTSATLVCTDCHRSDNTNMAIQQAAAGAIAQIGGWRNKTAGAASFADVNSLNDGNYAVPNSYYLGSGDTSSELRTFVSYSATLGTLEPQQAMGVLYGRSTYNSSSRAREIYMTVYHSCNNNNNNCVADSRVTRTRMRLNAGNARYTSRNTANYPSWDNLKRGRNIFAIGVMKRNNTAYTSMRIDYMGLGVLYPFPKNVRGPHGSLQKWLLTDLNKHIKYDANLDGDLNDRGDAPNSFAPNSNFSGPGYGYGNSTKYFVHDNQRLLNVFCFNCHRRDVYDNDVDNFLGTAYDKNPYGKYSRAPHPLENAHHPNASNFRDNWTQIWCINCHGGRTFEAVTAIPSRQDLKVRKNEFHGSFANMTVYRTDAGAYRTGQPYSDSVVRRSMSNPYAPIVLTRPKGVRLLHGAALVGMNVPSGNTLVNVTCYSADREDSMTQCQQHGNYALDNQGSFTAAGPQSTNVQFNYNYTSW